MLGRALPEHLRLGTIEGHFRCRWRVSRSGGTVTIVARHKSGRRRRSRMAAVDRLPPRWDTLPKRPVFPKPIVPPKAKMITFYKNGDPFHSGTKVSISPGKDFLNLDGLCDYLNQRINIPHGVRYIFSRTGRRITDLEDLLDGHSYIVAGTKNFQEMAYGQGNRIIRPSRVDRRQNMAALPMRQEDVKLFRPLSPVVNPREIRDWRVRTPKNLRSRSLPTQNEGKTITVVNSHDPTVYSRVLLNLRTTQSFEEIVEDLGQAIKIKDAKRIYNQSGDEVRSFSQLKNELKTCETFYIDTELNEETEIPDKNEEGYFSMEVNETDHQAMRQAVSVQAGSLPNLAGDRVEAEEEENVPPEPPKPVSRIPEPVKSPPTVKRRQPSVRKTTRGLKGGQVARERKRTAQPLKERRRNQSQESVQPRVQQPLPAVPTPDSLPSKRLELSWIHGYHGLDPGKNLYILSSGELAYYVGSVAILHHHPNATQRHYIGHSEDILCMSLHSHDDVLATGQGAGADGKSQAHIRVWKADDLTTIAVIGQGHLENEILGVSFSWEGSSLMIMEGLQNTIVTLWDWQNENEMSRETSGEEILGGSFHPLEDDLIITYGKQHLAFWLRGDNGHLDRQDPVSSMLRGNEQDLGAERSEQGRSSATFLALDFLSDGRLVTGNSRGFVAIWAPSEDRSRFFFVQKEFKAHEGEVSALLYLPDGKLISGSSNSAEQDGQITIWDTKKKFAKVASATLPTGSGGVTSLCPQKDMSQDMEIYVGTNKNVILEGSVMWTLNPVVHGHCDEVRALAPHPDRPCFVTAGLDKYICRWDAHNLIWKVQSDCECLSVTFHPHGSIVAVGDEHGDVTFLNMEDGLHVTTLPVTNSPLYTLKYSPDGDTLAVGCADGNIYLFQTHSNGYMYKIDFVLPGTVPILILDWSTDGGHIQAVFTDSEYHDIVFWNLRKKEKLHNASQVKELEWYKPNCTLGYKINGMWNNKKLPEAIHVCCHVSNSKQILAAGDKNGFVRLFRNPCTSEKAAFYEEKQCSTDVNAIQFLCDDKHLVTTGGPDGAVFIWKLSATESSLHR